MPPIPVDPQAPLEGVDYKPTRGLATPIKNAVDGIGAGTQNGVKQPSATVTQDWVNIARSAYDASETWLQAYQRAIWHRNIAHYRSEHSADSPIHAEANRHKSNYFFPKSRTLVRDIQASAAAAYFSNMDIVAIEAEDQDDPMQVDSANFIKELLNYRLSNTIPWYQTVLGGVAEAATLGVVVSRQSWEYKYEDVVVQIDPEQGVEFYKTVVQEDKPQIKLIPAENIRISPAADWIDPANSSPYFIELIPMYLGDVLDKIAKGESTKSGEPAWINLKANQLISAGNRDNLDPTRRARAGRADPKANLTEIDNRFRIVWIHRNIVRLEGKDWLYYTVGTQALLSEPIPLNELVPWAEGKRDYVIGCMEIETDRPFPNSPVGLASGMQKALNELKNQRYDNVRQVLNRRYLYRSGGHVDVRALSRNVPGGLIGISASGSLDTHVSPLPTQDVTASSFQEEDRMSLGMDDLTGSTTGSTVNSNRRLHETATGMNLMAEAGNKIREMELRTITETWLEKVLRQLVQLEVAYETDRTAMKVSAKRAGLQKIHPDFFNNRFCVSINVGMGAVSPTQRLQKIQTAVATVTQLIPNAALAIKGEELAKEIFSQAGYDNGSRFFDFSKVEAALQQQQDPAMQAKMQELELKKEIESGKLQVAMAKLEMEKERQALELNELKWQINLLIAKTSSQNVTSVFESANTAAVIAQTPGLAPSMDEILKSSGFVDHNGAPTVVQPPVAPQAAPQFPQNSHPNFPANPDVGISQGLQK